MPAPDDNSRSVCSDQATACQPAFGNTDRSAGTLPTHAFPSMPPAHYMLPVHPCVVGHAPCAAQGGLLTPQQLAAFDGRGGRRLYLAIMGEVYDVTAGMRHYGEAWEEHPTPLLPCRPALAVPFTSAGFSAQRLRQAILEWQVPAAALAGGTLADSL